MAQDAIETEPEFDGELAFDLVEGIIGLAQRAGVVERVEALIELIAARRPAAFAEGAGWFSLWRTEAALLRDGADVLTPLLAFAGSPGGAIDFLSPLIDRLRFHGRVDEAIAATLTAWTALRNDTDLIYTRQWLAEPAARLIIDRWLQSHPVPPLQDDSLWEMLAPLQDILDRETVEQDVELHARRPPRTWEARDFQGASDRDVVLLSLDFRDALQERFGWSLARAELAREALCSILFDHRPDRTPSSGGKGQQSTATRLVVLPDAVSFDKYLKRTVGFLGTQSHRAAAFALALPRWLSFLGELGLVAEREAARVASSVRQRMEDLPRIIGQIIYDPVLQDELAAVKSVN